MADLVITVANVGVADSSKVVSGVAGATVTRGDALYFDSADSKYKPTDASAADTATVVGIAQTEGGDGDYILVQKTGKVKLGAILTQGEVYYVSTNAGKIAPFADLVTGEYVSSIFRATSTSEAILDLDATGIQIP